MSAITAILPLTAERWPDLEQLFGPERGANSGCWCMWHRLRRRSWEEFGRDGRKAAFRAAVASGPAPGLLAYADGEPVGWVAVAPRATFPALSRSPIATTDQPADWAITCFYVASGWRRRGLMRQLIAAAVEHARACGALAIEAYPKEPGASFGWGDLFVGVPAEFLACGFTIVARPSPTRLVVRRSC